jgi:hypothetical protein
VLIFQKCMEKKMVVFQLHSRLYSWYVLFTLFVLGLDPRSCTWETEKEVYVLIIRSDGNPDLMLLNLLRGDQHRRI